MISKRDYSANWTQDLDGDQLPTKCVNASVMVTDIYLYQEPSTRLQGRSTQEYSLAAQGETLVSGVSRVDAVTKAESKISFL